MDSEELAKKVLSVCREAGDRITGIGDRQYFARGLQRVELTSLQQDLVDLEEELLDTINHSAMSILKLRSIREGNHLTTL